MGILDRFQAYADAFELSYEDDDWTRIEQFFTEGAIYEGDPDACGREAVLAKLKHGVDSFDRRMDSRTLEFEKPTVDGDTLTTSWTVTYTKASLPDLVISGVETAVFDGDRIALLRDILHPDAGKTIEKWMEAHGEQINEA